MKGARPEALRTEGAPKRNGTASNSRGRLIGLLIGVVLVIGILIAAFMVVMKRPFGFGEEWTGDRVVVVIGLPMLYLLLVTLPLVMVSSYQATWYTLLETKIKEDLTLCGLPREQVDPRLNEFAQRNSFAAFAGPMAINLGFLVVLWAVVFLPKGLGGLHYYLRGDRMENTGLWFLNLFVVTQKMASLAPTAAWAFMGAYFYSLMLLIRRWLQADLTTGVLWKLNVRIAVALVVGLLLENLPAGSVVHPGIDFVAFLAGIVPDTVLRWLNVQVKRLFKVEVPGGKGIFEPSDLQDKIDGLNFWQVDRLFDEGIESIQDLAMKEIPALMVSTRFDTPHLMHWIDQAILCNQAGNQIDLFKGASIRTATELLRVVRQRKPEEVLKSFPEPASAGAESKHPVNPISLPVLLNVVAALRVAPNVAHIQAYWQNAQNRVMRTQTPVETLPKEGAPLGGSAG